MLTAVLAGCSLSLAGLQMQSIFRNPLADPHIMGVSAGAGTGAAIATMIAGATASGFPIVLSAFLGAMVAFMLIMAVASHIQSTYTLLIFGVMLGFVFSAITSILEYSANEESLKIFYSWSAGSFMGTRPILLWQSGFSWQNAIQEDLTFLCLAMNMPHWQEPTYSKSGI